MVMTVNTYPIRTPTLHGPFTVNYTEILHDGDTKDIFTPSVGDVISGVFMDGLRSTFWDHGVLDLGTPSFPTLLFGNNTAAPADFCYAAQQGHYVFTAGNIIRMRFRNTSGSDPTQGHVELYILTSSL